MNALAGETRPIGRGRTSRFLGVLRTWIIGTLLCLTPPTSIIALGWLSTDMGRVARRRVGLTSDVETRTRWVLGPPGSGVFRRLLGGIATNIRAGFQMFIGLIGMTLPFSALWLSSWWSGWENSFNKGYEQAFVGAILGLAGVAIFAIIMIYLPMAIAHQAVENRAFAFFEFKRARSAVAHAGWQYVTLAATTVFFALPIFASRGLPVFAEGIFPGFADFSGQQLSDLRLAIDLATGAYIFASLVILRRWSARIYSAAVVRATQGRDRELWANSALSQAFGQPSRKSPWRVFSWVQLVLLATIWVGLAVLIFVGQFLNHDWHVWLSHPYYLLPWVR